MMMRKHSPGFSLIEMAVVMMILGILLSGLLTATGQSAANTQPRPSSNVDDGPVFDKGSFSSKKTLFSAGGIV